MNKETGWFWDPKDFSKMMRRGIRRGAVKYILLHMLSERPRHGYDIMQAFRGGPWRPGSGSIYPALSMLEESGLVQSREENGKRVYFITEEGQRHLREHPNAAQEFFEAQSQAPESNGLHEALHRLRAAVMQASHSNEEVRNAVEAILKNARKEIYTLLASE